MYFTNIKDLKQEPFDVIIYFRFFLFCFNIKYGGASNFKIEIYIYNKL